MIFSTTNEPNTYPQNSHSSKQEEPLIQSHVNPTPPSLSTSLKLFPKSSTAHEQMNKQTNTKHVNIVQQLTELTGTTQGSNQQTKIIPDSNSVRIPPQVMNSQFEY